MDRFFRLILVLIFLSVSIGLPSQPAQAATYRNWVAQQPASPTSQQSVRVWMNSDTAFGETAGLEYNIGSSYVKVLGVYDNLTYPGANWYADIPAQPNTTQVRYQLFTRNQSGSDYGFTGVNWNYTVDDGNIQWAGMRHDTFDSYYRSPFGAVTAGTPVTLRFRTDRFDVDGVYLRLYTYNPATQATTGPVEYPLTYLEDRVEGSTTYAIWSYTLSTPLTSAILYYKFRLTDRLDVDYYSDSYSNEHDNLGQGGEGTAFDDEPMPAFQITVYDPAFATPEWLQNANVYQIFPDRFRNGDPTNDYCRSGSTTGCPAFYDGGIPTVAHTTWNESIYDPRLPGPYANNYGSQFFGGDLKGIQDKLDYLQSLGIDTLYLTPIFSARSNHRYDTDNYLQVDPALGGDAAYQALVDELEKRGMYLILDGVFNHTSSDSLYFDRYGRYASAGACESSASSYRSWFNLFDVAPGSGVCADSTNQANAANYEGWFGFDSLAVITDNSSAARDYIYRAPGNVIQHWYDRGTSGWRFDVADEISHDWWREFRAYAKSYNPQGPLVGEVWYDASQFLAGDQLDSVMNYRFRKNILGFARGSADWNDNDNNGGNSIVALTPSQFDHALRSVREDYPAPATAVMLNLIDSHDTNRALYVLTILGDSGLVEAKERLLLTALFQFTYLGAPMVYYGDEAGLDSPSLANGVNGPEDDPYNRAPYPWADETGDANLYGPADSTLIDRYTALAHLRKEHPALRSGNFTTLLTGDTSASSSDNNTYAFARSGAGETAVVVMNNGAVTNSASVPVSAFFTDGAQLQDALSGGIYTVSSGSLSVSLAARSGALFFLAPAAADVTPPVASLSLSPAANSNGWNNTTPVTVNLSGSDGASGVKELRYWLDNGPVVIVPGASASLPVSQDNTSVSLRVVDQAGNISSLASLTVRIDTLAPETTIDSGPPSFTPSGSALFIFNSNEGSPIFECSLDGALYTACVTPQNLSGLNHGPHSFSVRAIDLASNVDSTPASWSWVVNNQPQAAAQSLETYEDTPLNLTLSGSDLDNDGLAFSLVDAPQHGNLGGTIPDLVYTPDPGYAGPDSFTFKVNDGYQDSASATISLAVVGVGNFKGYVDLQGRGDDQGAVIQVFAESAVGSPVYAQAISASSGSYQTLGQAGRKLEVGSTYFLYVDQVLYLPSWIQANTYLPSAILSNRPVTLLGLITLLGGDANDDNRIDTADLACLGAAYGSTNPGVCSGAGSTDVTGDGLVNLYDLTLLGGNYDLYYSPWTP